MWDPELAGFYREGEPRGPFVTLAKAIAALGRHETFPEPEAIDVALSPLAGVRFVRQAPLPRRRRRGGRAAREPSAMYDARIVNEGVVPTRAGSWHDLMNALVWATFPRAKRALHARQHLLVVPAKPGESLRRPRELDALALVDEGGVVLSGGRQLVFGHAIYEGLVARWPAPVSAAFEVEGPDVDAALAALLSDRSHLTDPRALRRVEVES